MKNFKSVPIGQIVDEMKDLANSLVPYAGINGNNYLELDLSLLKMTRLDFEGYTIDLHFSRTDLGNNYIESLQIIPSNTPFLPFATVAKLGKLFLGSHHLYLLEIIKSNRKIYLWSVYLDKSGKPVPAFHKQKTEKCVYDEFTYDYMFPNQVKFY